MTDRSSAPRPGPRTYPTTDRGADRTAPPVAVDLDTDRRPSSAWRPRRSARSSRRQGLHRLSRLEPPEPPNRYCRRHPGELIHIDIKKLGRFDRPGLPAHRRQARLPTSQPTGPGWDVRATSRSTTPAASPTSRSSTTRRAATCVGFLRRAIAWFAAQGVTVQRVMTDNGTGYRSKVHATADRRARDQAPPHPALPAPHQRQSRALHPDPPGRMGLRRQLPEPPATTPRPSDPGSSTTTAERPHSALGHKTARHRLTQR